MLMTGSGVYPQLATIAYPQYFLHYCQTDIHLEAQLKWVSGLYLFMEDTPSLPRPPTSRETDMRQENL